jgi:hypothetical protein
MTTHKLDFHQHPDQIARAVFDIARSLPHQPRGANGAVQVDGDAAFDVVVELYEASSYDLPPTSAQLEFGALLNSIADVFLPLELGGTTARVEDHIAQLHAWTGCVARNLLVGLVDEPVGSVDAHIRAAIILFDLFRTIRRGEEPPSDPRVYELFRLVSEQLITARFAQLDDVSDPDQPLMAEMPGHGLRVVDNEFWRYFDD